MNKQRKQIVSVVLLVTMLLLSAAMPVHADTYCHPTFYVMVNSSAGEINFRTGAGTVYGILGTVPNGTTLYITDVAYNMADQFLYGETVYAGRTGWVSLRQTRILYAGYPGPDFYATVRADAGSINFRTGPGMGYRVLFDIANGTQLHITDLEYNADDGFFWGYTYYSGYYGWVSIRQTNVRRDYGNGNGYNAAPNYNQTPSPDFGWLRSQLTGMWVGPASGFNAEITMDTITTYDYYLGTDSDVYLENRYSYTIQTLDSGSSFRIEAINLANRNDRMIKYYYTSNPGCLYPENPLGPFDYWQQVY